MSVVMDENKQNRAVVASQARLSALVEVLPQAQVDAAIVMLSEPFGARAEAIRSLRTHIVGRHLREGRRALAVCAPSEGVGCTFVAANLAVALSQLGLDTLLIDANLRQPALQRLFLAPAPASGGLAQCLSHPSPKVGQFVAPGVRDRLSLMFAGEPVPNPQELLGGAGFQTLMRSCLREFDVTIVDTPPANSCADAGRIASVVGYSLVVARRHVTLVEDIKTLISELAVDHSHVVGTVLNQY